HIFANSGNDLRWRAEITGPEDRSSHLYEITIEYSYEEPTSPALPWWAYVIIGGGLVLITLIIITVVVVSKKKKVATR
ncbi:MAG: GGIII-like transmembrane region-containing protein, partial [Candidatus Heimdallarchaeota archaeon]